MASKRRKKGNKLRRKLCANGCGKKARYSASSGRKICAKHALYCPKIRKNAQNTWLDWLEIPVRLSNREVTLHLGDGIGAEYVTVDGYLPPISKDTHKGYVYEFWGDFWHGNIEVYPPQKMNRKCRKPMGTLWEETQKKIDRLIEAGYKVIEIWENDWKKIKEGRRVRKIKSQNRVTYVSR